MPAIYQTILPTLHARDVVAVFTQNYTQIFPDARPIKAVIKEEARIMEHPVETGIVITDHRVILPVEIEISMVLTPSNFEDTYNQMRQAYLNGTLLIVQTKATTYPNQIIASMPHQEDPDQYDTITVALKLKQVLFVVSRLGSVPKKPSNVAAINRGTQQAKPITGSSLHDVQNYIFGGKTFTGKPLVKTYGRF